MKLRRIKVSGWRCFHKPLELTGLSDGLNVVHGPNGIGKSSLFQAIVRVLGDKHDGKGEAIRNLQSWGTELAPHAILEFEHAGQLWQVEKRFLHAATAKVSRHDGQRFLPIAELKQADERLREILRIETPRAGAVSSEHWGLAQMLWAEQGNLQIKELSTPARQALQNALGAQVTGGEATVVERRVQEEFDRYFTSTGKLKAGANAPAIVGLQERLRETQARSVEIRRRLEGYEHAVRRIEDRRMLVEQAERDQRDIVAAEGKIREKAEAYAALVHQRELALQEIETAKSHAERIRARQEQIANQRNELQSWKQKFAQLEEQAPLLQDDRLLKEQLAADAQRKVEGIRARRETIQIAERRAKRAEAFLRAEAKARAARQLLERLTELTQIQSRLRHERQQIVAPDAKTLAALRKASKERDEARVRWEASLITLEFIAEQATEVQVVSGEPAVTNQLAAGERQVAQGSPEVSLHLAGIGLVRARGPATSVSAITRSRPERRESLGATVVGLWLH